MKRIIFSLTIVAFTTLLHGSNAKLKELTKFELTAKVTELDTKLTEMLKTFKDLEAKSLTKFESITARLQVIEEKSKKDALDFCKLAITNLNRTEELASIVKAQTTELQLCKANIIQLRRLLYAAGIVTTAATVYGATRTETVKNWGQKAFAIVRGLIPSHFAPTQIIPVASSTPTNHS